MTFSFNLLLGTVEPSRSVSAQLDDWVEQIEVARSYGFTYAAVSQHWFSYPQGYLQPLPLIASLATACRGITFVSTIIQLPLLNPVDVAEQVVTVDHISRGHFILGVGLGHRSPLFEAFGVQRRHRGQRMEEAIALMQQLWTGEAVTFQGRHFTVHEARLAVRPFQRPRPPIWIAAQSEPAVRRAARIGDAPLLAPQCAYDDLEGLVKAYRDELAEAGKPFPHIMPLPRTLCVDRKHDVAVERFRASRSPASTDVAAAARHIYRELQEPTTVRLQRDFDYEVRHRSVVGTPQECVETLLRYHKDFGFNHFRLTITWPREDQKAKLDHLQFIGEEIVQPILSLDKVDRETEGTDILKGQKPGKREVSS